MVISEMSLSSQSLGYGTDSPLLPDKFHLDRNQTYNNQDRYKKPKDIHKKPQNLNLTKPN